MNTDEPALKKTGAIMAEIAWWLDSHVHLSMPSVSITTDV